MNQPVNLQRQIKRHITGRRQDFFAVTAPGLAQWCARELEELSETIAVEALDDAGVLFSGRLDDLYRVQLHSATAGRVLMRLDRFKATNFRQLEKRLAAVPWARYLPWGVVPACKVTAHQSRLYHTKAVAERVDQAVQGYWQGQGGGQEREQGGQTLYLRILEDVVTLSLDASGANLYLRGFKTHGGEAPLRETTAAAVLHMAGYDPSKPLLDPMCGTGTFSLEAALMAKQMPPGMLRTFAFMQWPSFRPRHWQFLLRSAVQSVKRMKTPLIHASDIDETNCRRMIDTVHRHGLDDAVTVQQGDFFSLRPPQSACGAGPAGLIVLNPPYGRRLPTGDSIEIFYKRIWAKLRSDFKGWRVAVVEPQQALDVQTAPGLAQLPLQHGGIALTLLVGDI